VAVFGVSNDGRALDKVQQFRGLIRGGIVDDDDFDVVEVVVGDRAQALKGQFGAIEEDQDDGDFGVVVARQAQGNFRRKKILQTGAIRCR